MSAEQKTQKFLFARPHVHMTMPLGGVWVTNVPHHHYILHTVVPFMQGSLRLAPVRYIPLSKTSYIVLRCSQDPDPSQISCEQAGTPDYTVFVLYAVSMESAGKRMGDGFRWDLTLTVGLIIKEGLLFLTVEFGLRCRLSHYCACVSGPTKWHVSSLVPRPHPLRGEGSGE